MEIDNNHFSLIEVDIVSANILNLTKLKVKVDLGSTLLGKVWKRVVKPRMEYSTKRLNRLVRYFVLDLSKQHIE